MKNSRFPNPTFRDLQLKSSRKTYTRRSDRQNEGKANSDGNRNGEIERMYLHAQCGRLHDRQDDGGRCCVARDLGDQRCQNGQAGHPQHRRFDFQAT